MHDFENPLASTSAAYRVLISEGCFAFSSSMSASLTSLLPYLPCLWARRFGFQQFILALPSLPSVQLDLEFAQIMVKEYQTLSSSIGITSLSTTLSFSSGGILDLMRFSILACPLQVKESFIVFLFINLPYADFLIFL